jgi:pilus assembly protein CpaC
MFNPGLRPHPHARPASLRRSLMLAAFIASASLFATFSQPALAQSTIRISDTDGASARRVDLGLGKSVIVDLPRDAKEVFVANPAVANAVVRSARKVFVIASAVGQTSLFFMDAAGNQIGGLDVNVQRDINPIRNAIHDALPGSDIVVKQLNDGVLLSGVAGSAQEAAQAASIAASYVGKADGVTNSITIRGGDQVMLKVTVAEVQRNVLKQLGVDLNGSFSVANHVVRYIGDNPFPLSNQAPTFGGVRFGEGTNRSTMRAFERTGVMKTLAEPTLTAVSGESAHFLAGGEIPTPTSQSCDEDGCITQLTYKPIGVSLNFTPVVLGDGRISLRVYTEVTELDYENAFKVNEANIPSFKTRKADTTVEVPSGGSLIMAGMIQNASRQVQNGTPGLMSIPILGQLFRSRDYQRNETELMIMVTPYLAKAVDAKDIPLPTDGFVDASDPSSWFLGRINRIYGLNKGTTPNGKLNGAVGFILD